MKKEYLIIYMLSIVYVLFVLKFIDQPPLADIVPNLLSAKYLAGEQFGTINKPSLEYFTHPPLYYNLISLFGKCFGEVNARSSHIFSIICFIITIIFIYKIVMIIYDDYHGAVFAAAIYTINSMAIQGSLVIDIDTTISPVFLLLFIYIFIKNQDNLHFKSIILLSIVFAFCWWTKIPLALIVILTFTIYLLYSRQRNINIIFVFICGFIIFLLTWLAYSYYKNALFTSIFSHDFIAFFRLSSSEGSLIKDLLRAAFRLMIWGNPFFIILGLIIATKKILKNDGLNKDIIIACASLIIFFGFLFTGRLTHSFPKYHYPLLSLLAILCGGWFLENFRIIKERLMIIAILIAFFVLYYYFIVGDILYLTDYAVREQMITGKSSKPLLLEILWKMLLYILPFFVILILLGKLKYSKKEIINHIYISSFVLIFSINLSMNFIHMRANYFTNYCYGGSGLEKITQYINNNLPDNIKIYAPRDLNYTLINKDVLIYSNNKIWNSKDLFLKEISKSDVKAVVYGVSYNSISQFNNVFNAPEVKTYLESNYNKNVFGSYTLWQRKN